MPYLIQLLLPTADNEGAPFPHQTFAVTRAELLERFGGMTAYFRAPAQGLWKTDADQVDRDEIVIFEVMADRLDRTWWSAYRERLRQRYRQEALVVRALPMDEL